MSKTELKGKAVIIGNVRMDENHVAHEVIDEKKEALSNLLSRIEQLEADVKELKGNK